VGPALADARIELTPPPDGRLRDTRALETGATVREYDVPDGLPVYHLVPSEYELDPDDWRLLADARRKLADGSVPDGEDAPGRAVRAVVGEHREPLADALNKHTRGFGVLEDCFGDPRVSDVYASAPVVDGSLRVTIDDETARTNVHFTPSGVARLASRLRAESGRPFSRANPTLDTAVEGLGTAGSVRVAGVTDPVSDGTGFAFRAHDADPFRLPNLVANDTLTPRLAGFLDEAVSRGASVLFAGARGAGKTTLLGATLWSLAPAVRVVTIEDTPELPVRALRADGRDVQALYASEDSAGADVSMTDALRTALRLGDGAIAVGEVRGEEARVLYEAMRVGSSDAAVLGTIHGDGAGAVRERVVSDLGVAHSSFAATDLVVTVAETASGRRVTRVEEVTEDGAPALYEDDGRAPNRRGASPGEQRRRRVAGRPRRDVRRCARGALQSCRRGARLVTVPHNERRAATVGAVAVALAFVAGTIAPYVGATVAVIGVAVAVALVYGPHLRAVARRSRTLGAAPDVVCLVVLSIRLEPALERATRFAASEGSGRLADSLAAHVREARGRPAAGSTRSRPRGPTTYRPCAARGRARRRRRRGTRW